MADELNTNSTPEESEQSENQPANTEAQPATPQELAKPVNLYDLPEFKNYQRNMDRQMAQLRQQATALEARSNQAVMANMDDFQKAQYERDQYAARAQDLQQQLENQLLIQQRFERISTLSQRTGVPIEELNKAETPDDLAFLVAEYKEKRLASQVEEETKKAREKAKANKVDVGGGGPRTESDNSLEAQFKAARGDPQKLARLLIRPKE